MSSRTSVVIVKSAAMRRGALSNIIMQIILNEFKIIYERYRLCLLEDLPILGYPDVATDTTYYKEIKAAYLRGVYVMRVASDVQDDTISHLLEVVGPLDPREAAATHPSSIRALHGAKTDDGFYNVLNNAVDVPRDEEQALAWINHFCPRKD